MKKHRKTVSFRFLFVCALCLAAGLFLALPAFGEAATSGLDVVIILDSSSSMNQPENSGGERNSSDWGYYRLDAATIMINMCDVTNTYLGVVPFANGLNFASNSIWYRMYNMADQGVRKMLSDSVMAQRQTLPGTNLAVAMEKAVEMLKDRQAKGSTNQPVILVLCDGNIDVSVDHYREEFAGKTFSWTFNGAVHTNERLGSDANNKQNREKAAQILTDRTLKARDEAVSIGSMIYSIPLITPDGKANYDLGLLQQLATESSEFEPVTAENLPAKFSRIFADTVHSNIRGATVNDLGSQCEIVVDIPNESVMEANILVPVSKVKDGVVRIFDPSGRQRTGDSEVITYKLYKDANSKTNFKFVHVKLVKPGSGEWKLLFDKADPLAGNLDLNVDTLYNYNIKLKAQTSEAAYYKNGALSVTARFVDENGLDSKDSALYNGRIKAYATILSGGVELPAAKALEMTADQSGNCFTLTVPIRDLGITASTQGLTVNINADGEGLYRELSLEDRPAFSVLNRSPEYVQTPSVDTIYIEQLDTNFLYVEKGPDIDFSGSFTDPDEEALPLSVQVTGGSDVVRAEINGGILFLRTRGREGAFELKVTAADAEGLTADLTISGEVKSDRKAFIDAVKPVLSIAGGHDQGKDADVAVFLRLESQNPAVAIDEKVYALAAPAVYVSGQELALAYDPAEGCLTGTFHTGKNQESHAVTGTVQLSDIVLTAEETAFKVGNLPPKVDDPALLDTALTKAYTIEKWVWGWPFHSKEVEPFTIRISDYFSDSPGDVLTFAAHAQAEETAAAAISAEDGGALLTVTPVMEGETTIIVTAADMDEAVASYSFTVKVESEFRRIVRTILMILAGIVVLILVWEAIYWLVIRKRWWRGRMQPVFNNIPVADVNMPRGGRREKTMYEFFGSMSGQFTQQAAVKGQVIRLLKGIRVRPGANRTVQVRVKLPKGITASQVQMMIGTGDILRKKRAVWAYGATLTIVYDGKIRMEWRLQ